MSLTTPQEIVAFWRAAGPEKWFGGGPAFDAEVEAALLPAHEAVVAAVVAAGGAGEGLDTAEEALARILLLDQVPRNVFRGAPRAFATDALALATAEAALSRGFDRAAAVEAPPSLRGFFYLPFMHAEDAAAQARCVALHRDWGDAQGLAFAEVHQDAITRFGRFPHRNPILGRTMTAEEQAYLDAGGFSA